MPAFTDYHAVADHNRPYQRVRCGGVAPMLGELVGAPPGLWSPSRILRRCGNFTRPRKLPKQSYHTVIARTRRDLSADSYHLLAARRPASMIFRISVAGSPFLYTAEPATRTCAPALTIKGAVSSVMPPSTCIGRSVISLKRRTFSVISGMNSC